MQTNCFAFKKYTANKNFSDGRTKQTRLMLLLIVLFVIKKIKVDQKPRNTWIIEQIRDQIRKYDV